MTDRSKADGVVSGAAYVVTEINDQRPQSLHNFFGAETVAMTVASPHQVLHVHGSARQDGDSVLVYEKDMEGTGMDVRTWRVQEHGGRLEATERSNF